MAELREWLRCVGIAAWAAWMQLRPKRGRNQWGARGYLYGLYIAYRMARAYYWIVWTQHHRRRG